MLKEAIEKIQELVESRNKVQTIDIEGTTYTELALSPIKERIPHCDRMDFCNLDKTNAQYISEYSDYKQYVDEKLDSSLTWDTRLSWTPQFLKQQNLTISADILNVLDSKTAVDTTNTGVATYASGRTFWLDVSMKF